KASNPALSTPPAAGRQGPGAAGRGRDGRGPMATITVRRETPLPIPDSPRRGAPAVQEGPMDLQFKYRYLPHGAAFQAAQGPRPAGAPPRQLHDNELVVDVGGTTWGYNGEARAVLDHHFFRPEGQFPSATAAVLHKAALIREHFQGRTGEFWLVAHRDPDFDAFAAMYLARGVLLGEVPADRWGHFGLKPEGWFPSQRGEVNWFDPAVAELPDERRWPVLVAAYAACVDNSRRLYCPRSRALHSVLYAALLRKRPYYAADNGAV